MCELSSNAHITVWNNTGAYLVWFVSSMSKSRQNLLAKPSVSRSLILLVVSNHRISLPQEHFACSLDLLVWNTVQYSLLCLISVGSWPRVLMNHGWIAGMCHEKAVQSRLPTCCGAGLHFQSRLADRGDRECAKGLSYLCKFLFYPL